MPAKAGIFYLLILFWRYLKVGLSVISFSHASKKDATAIPNALICYVLS